MSDFDDDFSFEEAPVKVVAPKTENVKAEVSLVIEEPKVVAKKETGNFDFLVRNIENQTYKIRTDLPKGEHVCSLTEIIPGFSNNENPKIELVFKTRAGGTAVDTISSGNYGKFEQAFNRATYLLKDNEQAQPMITKIRLHLAKLMELSNDKKFTYEIESSIADDNVKVNFDGSPEEIAIQKAEYKKAVEEAVSKDVSTQCKEAVANGLQIYKSENRTFAIKIGKEALVPLVNACEKLFQAAIGKRYLLTLIEKTEWKNNRKSTFINVFTYSNTK